MYINLLKIESSKENISDLKRYCDKNNTKKDFYYYIQHILNEKINISSEECEVVKTFLEGCKKTNNEELISEVINL